jgi:two-component system nitrogen regulation response regulator GlnG
VRELENVVKRAAILSAHRTLGVQDLELFLENRESASLEALDEMGLEEIIERRLKDFLSQVKNLEMADLYNTILPMTERPLIKLVLKQTKFNQIKAAKILGINRNTLRKRIKELGILLQKES